MPPAPPPSVLRVFLVRPSKYDDEGFVIRHWRGVIPSNSLRCLHALTLDVRDRRLLGGVEIEVHLVDEAVVKVPLRKIVRLSRRTGERVLVCLVGVQTNQFCRASDLALELRREGVAVMIGGFHVSGTLAVFPDPSPEIQRLVDAGVTVVAGEVEHRWADLLRDALHGELRPIYNFLNQPPDLSSAPAPIMDALSARKFLPANFGTLDCSRGCPFKCSFCTIINVQGRSMRHRSPECIAEAVRRSYRESGVHLYFFTDDNFARNPAWEATFDALIRLREEEGIALDFILQVDVLAHKLPRFVEKAARAGCSGVFLGIESLNARNLQDAGKTQNRVHDYAAVVAAWRAAGIRTHAGYIIGFPHDSEESVREDVERLIGEVQPDQASFFMLMPLPGSRDHQRMVRAGAALDPDYNRYDSAHECLDHPLMRGGAWTRAYREAWQRFYSLDNLKAILSRAPAGNYWNLFKALYWYKNSLLEDGAHPMLAGFVRLKDRTTRRPGFPCEGRSAHWSRRLRELYGTLRGTVLLAFEMEELWLATRHRSETERYVLEELARMRAEVHRGLRISELRAAYARARARLPSIEVPSRVRLFWSTASLFPQTRRDLTRFWLGLRWGIRDRRPEVLLRVDRVVVNAFRELRLVSVFLSELLLAGR